MPIGGNKLGQAYAKLRLDTSGFNRKLRRSQRKFRSSSGKMRSQAKKLGRSMKRMGMMAAAGAAAVGTAIVKMANEFGEAQKAARQVYTLMDTSEEQFEAIKKEISDLSEKYGIMQKEGMEAWYQITSATYQGSEATEVYAQAAESAIAGATDQKTAADALTTVLNAYGKSVDEVEDVSDTFFMTVKRGKTRFEELAKGISKVTSIAPQMGVSFKDVGAALATLTRAGQDTSEAVTNLGRLITEIGVKPADRLIEVLNDMGYAGEDAGKKILAEKGLYGAMQAIGEELKEQGKSWDQMLKRQQAMRAALVLTGKGAQGFAKDIELMADKVGVTEEAFKKMQDTFWYTKKQMTAAINALVVKLGSKFGPAITDLIENEIMPAIDRFEKKIGDITEMKQKITSFFEDATKVAKGFFKVMNKIGGITVQITQWTFDIADAETTLDEKIKAAFGLAGATIGGIAGAYVFGLPGMIAGALIGGWVAGKIYDIPGFGIKIPIGINPEISTEELEKSLDELDEKLKAFEKQIDEKLKAWKKSQEKIEERRKARIGAIDWEVSNIFGGDIPSALEGELSTVDTNLNLYEDNKGEIQKLGELLSKEIRGENVSVAPWFKKIREQGIDAGGMIEELAHSGNLSREELTKLAKITNKIIEDQKKQIQVREDLGLSTKTLDKELKKFKETIGILDDTIEKTFSEKMGDAATIASIFGDKTDVVQAKMSKLRQRISTLIKNGYEKQSEKIKPLIKQWEKLKKELEAFDYSSWLEGFKGKMSNIATKAKVLGDEFNADRAKMNEYRRAIDELIAEGYGPQDEELQKQVQAYKKLRKEIEKFDFSEWFKGFKTELEHIGVKAKIFGDEFDATQAKMSAYRRGIEKLISEGYRPGDKKLDKLITKWKNLQDSSTNLKDAVKNAARAVEEWANALPGILEDLGVDVGPVASGWFEGIGQGASALVQLASGNVWGAILSGLQGFASIIGGYNKKAKKELEELRKKLDTAFSIVNDALNEFSNLVSNISSDLLGPLSPAISGAISSLGDFIKLTRLGGDTMEGIQAAFSGLLSVTSGLIDSFIGLLQRSDAWKGLQSELEPLWDAFANALGALVAPLVALVDWIKEYLGIADETSDEMAAISDLNIAQGFERARQQWEAATPDEPITITGNGNGYEIPKWAKEIIGPIKNTLKPILDNIKNMDISGWIQSVWDQHIVPLATDWIPKVAEGIGGLVTWVQNNVDFQKIKNAIVGVKEWFVNNFPGELDKALGEMDKLFTEEGIPGLKTKIENLKKALETIGNTLIKVLSTAAGAIVGAIVGQWLGGAVGALAGAVAGGAAGLAFGEIMTGDEKEEGPLSKLGPILDVLKGIAKVVGGILKTVGQVLNGIFAIAKGLGKAVWNVVKGVAKTAANIVGGVVKTVGNVVGGIVKGIGNVIGGIFNLFQEGGIVTGPTPAIIGEAGPEAIIPLDRMNEFNGSGATKVDVYLDGKRITEKVETIQTKKNYRKSGSSTGGGYARS